MRLKTLLALMALGALAVWSQQVLERQHPADRVANGQAQAIDGDSLRVDGQEMRLKGIDAPEFNQTCQRMGKEVPCGREAASALRRILARGPVTCVGFEQDRYRRLLVTCRSLGADVGALMVKSGMAVSFGDYLLEEAEARNDNRGLWSGTFEMPRDWRAAHPRSLEPSPRPAAVPTPPQKP